jgi:hypothetical protein
MRQVLPPSNQEFDGEGRLTFSCERYEHCDIADISQ